MTDSGDKEDRDGVPASSTADSLLKGVAAAPERTMPSPRADGGGDAEQFAHFTVLGRLGAGGMGIVYRARDEKLGRLVALKVLPPEFEADETKRQRLVREARVAAAVTHPNLTTIHEIGESEGRIFIAMELVEGRPLRDLLGDRSLPVGTLLHLMTQIAAGVAKAHAAGIVHRDLKPENILVSNDNHVKVLDFGLAKRPADALLVTGTGEGMLMGTPAYMAPEQAHGKPVTAATDVFALGVLLHEMLTSQRPFTGKNLPQLIRSIERDTPSAPSAVNPLVPAAFDGIVARCLAKEPAERYPDAQALLEDLRKLEASSSRLSLESTVERSVVGDSLVTPAPSTVPRGGRPWRKGLMLVGVLVAAGGVLGAVATLRHGSAPALSPVASASASAAPQATTLADLPPPVTKNPEAASEYASGMQALHDDSWGLAGTHFERAAVLDPTMAEAHLRSAMCYINGDVERRRAQFARAATSRARLTERDRGLLDALEPVLLRVHQDRVEALKRVEATSALYPLDVEFYDWVGILCFGDPNRVLRASQRALALDANDGQALQNEGMAFMLLGRNEEARSVFSRCADLSVDSADCLAWLAGSDGGDGRCAEAEQDAQRAADRDPKNNQIGLLAAMVALERPQAALRDVFRRAVDGQEGDDRPVFTASVGMQLAIVGGDFVAARALAESEARLLEAHPTASKDYARQYSLAASAAQLALEMGDEVTARRVARDFTERNGTWSHNDITGAPDLSLWLERLAIGASAEFEKRRRTWLDAQTLDEAFPGSIWTFGYAAPAISTLEASSALEQLPRYQPVTSYSVGSGGDCGIPDAEIGRVFLLAGQPDAAVPYLRRAAAHCGLLNSPMAIMHATLDLGRALEATGDTTGACGAYRKVLARWGAAKPRSVTADKARARSKALACP